MEKGSKQPAIGYKRVSTEEQARAAVTMDAQRAAIQALCSVKSVLENRMRETESMLD